MPKPINAIITSPNKIVYICSYILTRVSDDENYPYVLADRKEQAHQFLSEQKEMLLVTQLEINNIDMLLTLISKLETAVNRFQSRSATHSQSIMEKFSQALESVGIRYSKTAKSKSYPDESIIFIHRLDKNAGNRNSPFLEKFSLDILGNILPISRFTKPGPKKIIRRPHALAPITDDATSDTISAPIENLDDDRMQLNSAKQVIVSMIPRIQHNISVLVENIQTQLTPAVVNLIISDLLNHTKIVNEILGSMKEISIINTDEVLLTFIQTCMDNISLVSSCVTSNDSHLYLLNYMVAFISTIRSTIPMIDHLANNATPLIPPLGVSASSSPVTLFGVKRANDCVQRGAKRQTVSVSNLTAGLMESQPETGIAMAALPQR